MAMTARFNSGIFTGTGCACLVGALLMACAPVMAQERPFGTLFTTPDERDYLDYLRQDFVNKSQSASFNIEEDVIPEIPVVEDPEPEPEEVTEYRFGGIMTRINGNRMLWLNGKQVREMELPANMSLVDDAGMTVLSIRANGTSYRLKPGQSINLTSSAINEFDQGDPPTPTADTAADGNDAAGEPATTGADDDADAAGTPADVNVASNSDPSDLGAVIDRLNLGDEDISDEQRQNILDILTEQIDTPE